MNIMDPTTLVPTPDAIPVPWGWFYVLLMLTFLLHLLVMNAMLGGGIIALLSSFGRQESDLQLAREVSYKWPYTIAFAVNMGVAPLLFVQVIYGHFIYSSSVLMATWWLSIIGLLILAYYTAYIFYFKFVSLGRLRTAALLLAVGLLLVIGFFFTNNMTLMLQPDRWLGYFQNRTGTLLNIADPILLPRYLHFVTGSVGVAGLYLALIGYFRFRRTRIDQDELIAKGMYFFKIATMIQIVIGIWFLFSLPTPVRGLLLGGSTYGTVLLLIGIILAGTALYLGIKKRLMPCVFSTLALLATMIFIRDFVRIAYLKPYFSVSDLTVRPEYSPMIFFLVVFAVGLALIGYMLKLAFGCRKEVIE
jgi:hypothetical protein